MTIRSIMLDTLAVFYRLRILKYYESIPETRLPDPPPFVSIVIACPAPSAYLDEALAAIACQTYRRFEVILLPDAPSGRARPEGVREIPTGSVRPAEKRNRGIAEARGDIVAFLDDDAYPAEHWLECALPYFSIPHVSAVGGPAVTPPNDPYLALLGGRVYANPIVSGHYRYRYHPTRVLEIDDFPTCNLLVRTEDLRAVGGFRTDFWPGEDTYLCMELTNRLHRRILYDPSAVVFHHRRPLFLPHLRQIARYGLHRGFFARRFPATSRRLGYVLPSLLVLGIVLGLPPALTCPPCRWLYLGTLAVYAAATLAATLRLNPVTWLLTWLGVVLTHMVYGVRFLIGLSSRRLPASVQRFDHPAEQKDGAPA
jgi:hypothetical protein